MTRTESPSQGYRLTAASLPCPRRSFGTSHKGAEPTFYADRRLVRSQEPLILLNSQKASVGAQSWLASLVIRSEGTYGRGDRRRTRGTTVVEGFRSWHKIPPRRACERSSLRPCFLRRRKYPARRRELFSLRKKRTAGIRLPAWQEAGSLYRLNSHPFSSLEKPLKITGIQGESLPHPTRRQKALGDASPRAFCL